MDQNILRPILGTSVFGKSPVQVHPSAGHHLQNVTSSKFPEMGPTNRLQCIVVLVSRAPEKGPLTFGNHKKLICGHQISTSRPITMIACRIAAI